MTTKLTRRKFLQLAAVSAAAALGLGAGPVAEAAETEPDTLLGVPIEVTNFDKPETVLIGPAPAEMLAPDAAVTIPSGEFVSAIVPMQDYDQILLMLAVGTIQPDTTVEFSIEQSNDPSMDSACPIPGKNVTSLHGPEDSDSMVCVEITADELYEGCDFIHFTATATGGEADFIWTPIGGTL